MFYNKNMYLQDIAYNTLYHSDIETLSQLCYTNKTYKNICTSIYFWQNYFDKHNLPYNGLQFDNVEDWINEFIYVETATIATYDVMLDLDTGGYIFQSSLTELDIHNLAKFDNEKTNRLIYNCLNKIKNNRTGTSALENIIQFVINKSNENTYILTIWLVKNFINLEQIVWDKKFVIFNISKTAIIDYIYQMFYKENLGKFTKLI